MRVKENDNEIRKCEQTKKNKKEQQTIVTLACIFGLKGYHIIVYWEPLDTHTHTHSHGKAIKDVCNLVTYL